LQQSSPFLPLPLSLLCPCAVVDHPSERSSIYISNRISVFPHHRQHSPLRLLGNVCDGAMTPQTGSVHSRTRGNFTCSSLRQCISVTLSALLQPHPPRCAFALHARGSLCILDQSRQSFLQRSCGIGGCVGVDHCARFSARTCM
jgi:hypothetical protein